MIKARLPAGSALVPASRPATGLLALLCGLLLLPLASGDEPALAPFSAEKLREHVAFLASDDLAGRDSGDPGLEVAAEYIANRFQEIGLEPAGDNGSYFQYFGVPMGASFGRVLGADIIDPKGNKTRLQSWVEVLPFGYGEAGPVDAPLVFAGYGVTTGDDDRKAGLNYDDYAGLDVKGKAVILLRFVPRGEGGSFGGRKSPHAALAAKLRNARDHGAAAAIIVTPPSQGSAPEADPANDLLGLARRASPRQPTLPALLARSEVARDLLARVGKDLASVAREIDESLAPRSFELEGLRVKLDTAPGSWRLRNVVARIGASDPVLAKEALVLGAHYDHIGRFGEQVSLKNLGKVHNGADDNASGVAGILELARTLKVTGSPGRSLIFICFSGEEVGLLGSKAWLDAPRRFRVESRTAFRTKPGGEERGAFLPGMLVEPAGQHEGDWLQVRSVETGDGGWIQDQSLRQVGGQFPVHRLAAMLNLDMIGRARPDGAVQVIGANTSAAFAKLVEEIGHGSGVKLQPGGKGLGGGGSDHSSFIRREIPALFFFTGMHPQYNTPDDDTATLDYQRLCGVLDLARQATLALARAAERPTFEKQALAQTPGGHGKPRLGVMVNLDSAESGARVENVDAGSPAAKAGMRAGDVILVAGEKQIRRGSDLPDAIEELAEDEEIPFKVARGEREEVLKVIFPARRGGFRVSFGSMPDYAFAGRGVRFEGIREPSPAAKAGVKTGDVLVRWGEKDVEDVEQWTALLGRHKPGDEVPIELKRGDTTVKLVVKLEARD